MIRVLICCGGGFSSSFMAKKVNKEIIEKGYEDRLEVTFSPFSQAHVFLDKMDVIMCCTHLSYKIPEYIERYGNTVPFYVIPARMYGTMYVEDIYEDAEDIIDGYKNNHMNPFHFPNEEACKRVERIHSYRREVLHKNKA